MSLIGSESLTSFGVLFVDLDDTLIRTDSLFESILQLASSDPSRMGKLFFSISKGRAQFKRGIVEAYDFDCESLPVNLEVMKFIVRQRELGVRVVLATAADMKIAEKVAARLGVFDSIIATEGDLNLKGEAKLRAIKTYCAAERYERFAYAGDSHSDLCIWREASTAVAVNPGRRLRARLEELKAGGTDVHEIHSSSPGVFVWVRALRLKQWAKNLLIAVPVLLSDHPIDLIAVGLLICAFLAFGLAASSIYLMNDLLDLSADRCHPHKRNRPLASGDLPIRHAILAMPILMSLSLALGAGIGGRFLFTLVSYLVLTTLYSFWLKRKLLVDVVLLSVLYTLRLFAGGVAIQVVLSEWLLAFSIFIFFSLGLVKRYGELSRDAEQQERVASRRAYVPADLSIVESMGISSGFLAILVFALYIQSSNAVRLYKSPSILWFACPILLYWVSRLWMLARRGLVREDPLVFVFGDKISLYVALLIAIIVLAARHAYVPLLSIVGAQ